MIEQIKLREGTSLHQSTAKQRWNTGVMIGTVTMADNIGYALIRTERGEYDLVPFYSIININNSVELASESEQKQVDNENTKGDV